MKIAILGRGNMGAPMADLARQAGHDATALGCDDDAASAIRGADLVMLALHFGPAQEMLSRADVREALVGKILIDASNPLSADFMSLTVGHDTSAGEILAALVPGARVVKAFNTVFAGLLKTKAEGGACPVPVYIAGDDAEARAQVVTLVEDMGLSAIESGPLGNARYLEPMAEMMIQFGYGLGYGADVGFALVKAA